MERDFTMFGTEVVENTFVRREFRTNAQDNIGCHLKMREYAAEDGNKMIDLTQKMLEERIKNLFPKG